MKTRYIILCLCFVLLISCERNDDSKILDGYLNGLYTGTFERMSDISSEGIANVNLTFYLNNWSGTSDSDKYPALCRGTYNIKYDSIDFFNECAWTADFDWSLILSDKYKIERFDDSVKIFREYNSLTVTYKDIYKLSRK